MGSGYANTLDQIPPVPGRPGALSAIHPGGGRQIMSIVGGWWSRAGEASTHPLPGTPAHARRYSSPYFGSHTSHLLPLIFSIIEPAQQAPQGGVLALKSMPSCGVRTLESGAPTRFCSWGVEPRTSHVRVVGALVGWVGGPFDSCLSPLSSLSDPLVSLLASRSFTSLPFSLSSPLPPLPLSPLRSFRSFPFPLSTPIAPILHWRAALGLRGYASMLPITACRGR